MLKRITIESLQADLGSVEHLLSQRTAESDPIGFMQLTQRRERLTVQLDELMEHVERKAAVALFFAGGPVVGSRGIDASFAGRAVGLFQGLVSKKFAAQEVGEIGRRGPVAMQMNSDLLVTDIVRGSVGLVLEEADQNDTLADTQLKVIVEQVVSSISAAGATAVEEFDEILDGMEPRYLKTLSELFALFDESHAIVRMVGTDREVRLDSDSIRRGRERTSAAEIQEAENQEFVGRFFLLPAARRFELVITDQQTLVGTVSNEFARGGLERLLAEGGVLGERWRVRINVRTLRRPNREPKLNYTLMSLAERVA